MVYKYKVTLAGIKGFYRTYLVNGNNSLYTFHKQLRSDLEFPADQPILFKALDENGDCIARYALMDLGFGTVDTVRICDTIKAGVVSMVYFYDIPGKKNVIITIEGEEKGADVKSPTVIETKGPLPIDFENGYVAFEDLPKEERKSDHPKDEDDDEEDDEEEDSDKEDEELIYEEDEQ